MDETDAMKEADGNQPATSASGCGSTAVGSAAGGGGSTAAADAGGVGGVGVPPMRVARRRFRKA